MADVEPQAIHRNAIVIDGANASKFDETLFHQTLMGGVTAANVMVSVFDNFKETILKICVWKRLYTQLDALLMPIHRTDDFAAAKDYGKLGIILGLQNTTAIEEDLELIPVLKGMGIRIMQLTHNERNYVADGCFERVDAGLSRFGLEVLQRLNEHHILVDLSHAGPRSTVEAMERTKAPVAVMHASPKMLCDYPRNKTDEQIKLLAQKGGVFGCSFWPYGLKKGAQSTLSDYVDTIDHVVDLVGINYTAIASDFCMNRTQAELQRLQSGRAKPWQAADLTWPVVMPEGLREPTDYLNVSTELARRGYSERDITKILGGNFIRLFEQVW